MALFGLGLSTSPAAAASPLNFGGVWVNSADYSSVFHLKESANGEMLTASWTGGTGVHASVVGGFSGTVNTDGSSFTGAMHVSEAGNPPTGGTMTIRDATPAGSRIPVLAVTYRQDNGVAGNFKLTAYALENQGIEPARGFDAVIEFFCPSQKPCQGDASFGLPAGGAGSIKVAQRAARHAARKGILGSKHFSVPGGQAAKITLRLNKAGRKLLARRGKLTLILQIKMNPSSGLPSVANAGRLTLHKK